MRIPFFASLEPTWVRRPKGISSTIHRAQYRNRSLHPRHRTFASNAKKDALSSTCHVALRTNDQCRPHPSEKLQSFNSLAPALLPRKGKATDKCKDHARIFDKWRSGGTCKSSQPLNAPALLRWKVAALFESKETDKGSPGALKCEPQSREESPSILWRKRKIET